MTWVIGCRRPEGTARPGRLKSSLAAPTTVLPLAKAAFRSANLASSSSFIWLASLPNRGLSSDGTWPRLRSNPVNKPLRPKYLIRSSSRSIGLSSADSSEAASVCRWSRSCSMVSVSVCGLTGKQVQQPWRNRRDPGWPYWKGLCGPVPLRLS